MSSEDGLQVSLANLYLEERSQFTEEGEIQYDESSFTLNFKERDTSIGLKNSSYTLIKSFAEEIQSTNSVINFSLFSKSCRYNDYNDIQITANLDVGSSTLSNMNILSVKITFDNCPTYDSSSSSWTISAPNNSILSSANPSRDFCLSNYKAEAYQVFSGSYKVTIKRKVIKKVIKEQTLDDHWPFATSYRHFRDLERLSDFTFNVQGKELKVHKLILLCASEVFKTMIDSSFDESKTNSSKIDDISSDVFEILLKFIYGDQIEFEKAAKTELLYDLFEAAHKYQMKVLENYCIARIFKELTSTVDAFSSYSLACRYEIQDLKEYCWEVIQYDVFKIFIPMKPIAPEKLLKHFKDVQGFAKEWANLKKRFRKTSNEILSEVEANSFLKKRFLDQYMKQELKYEGPI